MGEVEMFHDAPSSKDEEMFVDAVQQLIAFITAGDTVLKELEDAYLHSCVTGKRDINQSLLDQIFRRKGELVVAYVERARN
jgi:hypothetical protein